MHIFITALARERSLHANWARWGHQRSRQAACAIYWYCSLEEDIITIYYHSVNLLCIVIEINIHVLNIWYGIWCIILNVFFKFLCKVGCLRNILVLFTSRRHFMIVVKMWKNNYPIKFKIWQNILQCLLLYNRHCNILVLFTWRRHFIISRQVACAIYWYCSIQDDAL